MCIVNTWNLMYAFISFIFSWLKRNSVFFLKWEDLKNLHWKQVADGTQTQMRSNQAISFYGISILSYVTHKRTLPILCSVGMRFLWAHLRTLHSLVIKILSSLFNILAITSQVKAGHIKLNVWRYFGRAQLKKLTTKCCP